MGNGLDEMQQVMQQCLHQAFRQCRLWLKQRGFSQLEHPYDRRAAMAVLQEAMRQAVLERLELRGGVTVYVGEAFDPDRPGRLWYLSVFGAGIWNHQFDYETLLSESQEPHETR